MFRFSRRIKRVKFTEDLSLVKEDIKELSIKSTVDNINCLKDLKSLEKISIFSVNQDVINSIVPLLKVKELKLYDIRFSNFEVFSIMSTIEKIDIEWCTKPLALWDMTNNTKLVLLSIKDFSKLQDLSLISTAKHLKELEISGGMNTAMHIKTLDPIKELSELEILALGNLRIDDSSLLSPIASLHMLKELDISNQFPTEQYARLSVLLPHAKSRMFEPYFRMDQILDGKDIMVVGSRKPLLSSKHDKDKLDMYARRYRELQDRFRVQ